MPRFRLITDPREIRKRTGFHTKNPKPLCNQCDGRTHKVSIDLGKKIAKRLGVERFEHIGNWCDNDLHFYPAKRVINSKPCDHPKRQVTIDLGKKISEEAGIPRFPQIGLWCRTCRRFDRTRDRRVSVERKRK